MTKYIIKRILLALMVLAAITTISFILIKLVEPEANLDIIANAAEKARREALGYDRPIMVQYWIFLVNIFTRWDWGTSFEMQYMANVSDMFLERIPPTLMVNFFAILFSVPIGLALGIIGALKKNKWQDHTISLVVMFFISVPSYIYALLMQYWLSFRLSWFPTQIFPLSQTGERWLSIAMLYSMTLPILALSFGRIAGLSRSVRGELTEALTSEYMLLARAKGLKRRHATIRHALKNALVPILPGIIGMVIGMLSGSLIIEKIFGIPGVGNLFIDSIFKQDYNVFMGVTVFYTAISVLSGIFIDISNGFLDPRIRIGSKKK